MVAPSQNSERKAPSSKCEWQRASIGSKNIHTLTEAVAPYSTVGGREVVKMNPEQKLLKVSTRVAEPAMYPPMLPNALPGTTDQIF